VSLDVDVTIQIGSEKGYLEASAKCGRRKLGNTTIEYKTDPTAKADEGMKDE